MLLIVMMNVNMLSFIMLIVLVIVVTLCIALSPVLIQL
jgi:hypothetical protein